MGTGLLSVHFCVWFCFLSYGSVLDIFKIKFKNLNSGHFQRKRGKKLEKDQIVSLEQLIFRSDPVST